MAKQNRLSELNEIIHTRTQQIQSYLNTNDLPEPSLELGTPFLYSLPPKLQLAQSEVINASIELNQLIAGPFLHISNLLTPSTHLFTAFHAVHRFQIAAKLEPQEQITFANLAARCGMDESDLRRVVRSCLAWQMFAEPRKGVVAHNAVSLAVAKVPFLTNRIGALFGVLGPAGMKGVEQMRKWPGSQDPTHSGYALATRREGNMFDILHLFPEQADDYTKMMDTLGSTPMLHLDNSIRDLEWSDFDVPKVIVDIAGANGALCAGLLRKFPGIQTGILQDLPKVIAKATIPEDLKSRMQFQAHDFLTPQPVKADVYFLRQIIHDWPEPQCIEILRNLVPALRNGARLIIHEMVLLEHGKGSIVEERLQRGFDLVMKTTTNSQERDEDEWRALMHAADPALRIVSIRRRRPAVQSVIEVRYIESKNGDDS